MVDGRVIHQLRRSLLHGWLPSLMHNSESGIRVGVRGFPRHLTHPLDFIATEQILGARL
jgi:hypothetical protein